MTKIIWKRNQTSPEPKLDLVNSKIKFDLLDVSMRKILKTWLFKKILKFRSFWPYIKREGHVILFLRVAWLYTIPQESLVNFACCFVVCCFFVRFFFVPRLFEEKRRDIVFGIPSFRPSVRPSVLPSFRPPNIVGTLCAQLLLQFYADSFETLQMF